jgi:PLP dependent protein
MDARMPYSREMLLQNLGRIQSGIAAACARSGRDPDSVRVVAAAKTVPAELVRWAVEAGVPDVGENYVKELARMRRDVDGARWHYIGALQSNTAHKVAEDADVVQTLASERATARLARRAAERGRTLLGLIEVDFTGERTGIAPEEIELVADRVASLEGLRLAGLMTLPPMPVDPEDARPHFRRLREMLEAVRRHHPQARELSMGMSMDYAIAVEEGATMVRIGTALFGERPPAS